MEAKVDVRKLQILNDRINQTIDALNQVRVSVHGLGHTGMPSQFGSPFQGLGYGPQQGLGFQNPYTLGSQGGFPGIGGQLGQMSQLGSQQGFPGIGLGFQHSPFVPQYVNPFLNPFTNPYTNPSLLTPWGVSQTQLTGNPWTGMGGVAGGLGGGLFHSNPDIIDRQLAEVRASDPYRISQTFPFVVP